MNPELRRHVWLEMTPHRLVAAPAILLLVFALFAAGGDEGGWRERLYGPAVTLTFVILFLWGTHQAAESVTEEVREHTWDLQRLSALGPWDMTVGKLLGAPLFAWYAGGLCLATMAVATTGLSLPVPLGWMLLATVAGALLVHAAVIAASLQAVRHQARASRRFATLLLLVPVFLLMWVGPFLDGREGARGVTWFGMRSGRAAFVALSVVAFAGWAVLGAYRSFCRELQVRTRPWAWPAFALFAAAWATGFAPADVGFGRAFVGLGLLATLAATYFALLTEPADAMQLRRMAAAFSRGDSRRVLEELPLWSSTLALAYGFALVAPAAFSGVSRWLDATDWYAVGEFVRHAPLALAFAALRDAAVFVYFASAPRPRRAAGAAMLYLALLWWVVPGLLAVAGLSGLASVVNPFLSWSGLTAAVVMAVQAALASGLAVARWRRHYGRPRKG